MSAPLSESLFHGTSTPLKEGSNVKPLKTVSGQAGTRHLAYATPDLEEAKSYAADRAHAEGMLFGPVYAVSKHEGDWPKRRTVPSFVRPKKYVTHVISEKGFAVNKLIGWGS